MGLLMNMVIVKELGRIPGVSRSPSSFLPAKKEVTDGRTDRRADGRTHPLIELWLTTKNLLAMPLETIYP